jgi:ATP phosphoribosyltransferase
MCCGRNSQVVANLADLGFGGCRLSVAVQSASPYRSALDLPAHCRVASKFVHCARAYFQSIDLPVEICTLSGSVKLGPITGMSEAIVDLVSHGHHPAGKSPDGAGGVIPQHRPPNCPPGEFWVPPYDLRQ